MEVKMISYLNTQCRESRLGHPVPTPALQETVHQTPQQPLVWRAWALLRVSSLLSVYPAIYHVSLSHLLCFHPGLHEY